MGMSHIKTILVLLFILFTSIGFCSAKLVFNGTPAAENAYLCTFAIQKNISRKMEIRGAKEPPQQILRTDFTLTGKLEIRENSPRGLLFQFTVDSFQWFENGVQNTAVQFRRAKIQTGIDNWGTLRLCRLEDDALSTARVIPPSLKDALLELGRSLRTDAAGFLGENTEKAPGAHWLADDRLIQTIVKYRNLSGFQQKDWDSKVLYYGQEKYFDSAVDRVDLNLFTNSIPGYVCRLDILYRFPVEKADTNPPLDYRFNMFESVDKVMPENNPLFSGTKFTEFLTLSVRRSLIPVKQPENK